MQAISYNSFSKKNKARTKQITVMSGAEPIAAVDFEPMAYAEEKKKKNLQLACIHTDCRRVYLNMDSILWQNAVTQR